MTQLEKASCSLQITNGGKSVQTKNIWQIIAFVIIALAFITQAGCGIPSDELGVWGKCIGPLNDRQSCSPQYYAIGAWEIALALSAVWCGLGGWLIWRRICRGLDRVLVFDLALVMAITIGLRLVLTEPSMANWYSNFLRASGFGQNQSDQLRPVANLFQVPIRAILPWTDNTLFTWNLVLGAVGGCFAYLAFRALKISRSVNLVAAMIVAVMPQPARIGWSASQHIFASLLFFVLLFVWLELQEKQDRVMLAFAMLTVPLLGLTRPDALALVAIVPFWGLGRTKLRRRGGLAFLLLTVTLLSSLVIYKLVAAPIGEPIPPIEGYPVTAKDLFVRLAFFRQFIAPPNIGTPNWLPLPITYCAMAGAIFLLWRKTGLLVKIMVTLALPQILLRRYFNAEGLIGARYFLPFFYMLALCAASGIEAGVHLAQWCIKKALKTLGAGLDSMLCKVAGFALAAVTVAWSWPLYHYRYTYQEEYNFLKSHLADVRQPCRVYYLRVNDDPLYRTDPDCCLDAGRSPLTLALPTFIFEPLPLDPKNPRLPEFNEQCQYYYDGAICSYDPVEKSDIVATLHKICGRLAQDPRLELVSEKVVPAQAIWRSFFSASTVHLRLFRMRNPDSKARAGAPLPVGTIPSPRVRVSQIVRMYQGSLRSSPDLQRSWGQAHAEMEIALKQLHQGVTFATLAQEHSDCLSRARGGDLGWIERGRMHPAFERAAFNLPIGGISGVVETPFGFHIIKRTE